MTEEFKGNIESDKITMQDKDKEKKNTSQAKSTVKKRSRRRTTLRPMENLYQQIYDTAGNIILGFDSCLQINDKKLGCLSYEQIESVAEKSTLIYKVGKWQLEEACMLIKRAEQKEKHIHRLFITVSPKYILKPNFIDAYQKLLTKNGIPYKRICIQLVESGIVNEGKELVGVINSLRELGSKVALTEFGAEASSFIRLNDMKVDYIKLDSAFMEDPENQRTQDITESIVDMAEKLDVLVIADGVDTKEQLNLAKHMRCFLVEGKYFSTPEREDVAI